jgi:hypothetical protein
MPYWVVLKDERRALKDEHPTSDIERPTSNEKQIFNAEAISLSFQPF